MKIGSTTPVTFKMGNQPVLKIVLGNVNTTGSVVWTPQSGFPYTFPIEL